MPSVKSARMSRADIVYELTQRTPFNEKEANLIMDILADIMVEAFRRGEQVNLPLIGTFTPHVRKVPMQGFAANFKDTVRQLGYKEEDLKNEKEVWTLRFRRSQKLASLVNQETL